MKIAITASGNSTDSSIDRHFARCFYFVIYDTMNREFQFLENPHRMLKDNAGPAVVEYLHSLQVKRIISGEFGLKVKAILDELKIQMVVITDHQQNVADILLLLKKIKK